MEPSTYKIIPFTMMNWLSYDGFWEHTSGNASELDNWSKSKCRVHTIEERFYISYYDLFHFQTIQLLLISFLIYSFSQRYLNVGFIIDGGPILQPRQPRIKSYSLYLLRVKYSQILKILMSMGFSLFRCIMRRHDFYTYLQLLCHF